VFAILLVVLFVGMALTDTTEYQPEIIKGDTPLVSQALDELKH
jgi:hypothetical protein